MNVWVHIWVNIVMNVQVNIWINICVNIPLKNVFRSAMECFGPQRKHFSRF